MIWYGEDSEFTVYLSGQSLIEFPMLPGWYKDDIFIIVKNCF